MDAQSSHLTLGVMALQSEDDMARAEAALRTLGDVLAQQGLLGPLELSLGGLSHFNNQVGWLVWLWMQCRSVGVWWAIECSAVLTVGIGYWSGRGALRACMGLVLSNLGFCHAGSCCWSAGGQRAAVGSGQRGFTRRCPFAHAHAEGL